MVEAAPESLKQMALECARQKHGEDECEHRAKFRQLVADPNKTFEMARFEAVMTHIMSGAGR